METYRCPSCGADANDAEGCPSCGRPPDPVAAMLARLERTDAELTARAHEIAADWSELNARRTRIRKERAALANAIAERLAAEAARTGATAPQPDATPPDQTRAEAEAQAEPRTQPTLVDTAATTVPRQRVRSDSPPPAVDPFDQTTYIGMAPVPNEGGRPETTTRSVQNTLLALGGLLLGIAAIVFTVVAFTTQYSAARAFILALMTTLALAVPVLLARRYLTATAETVASFGLLLVLLDGFAAYQRNLGGIASVPKYLFYAILLALVAAVAAAYRLATNLAAPQFTALIVGQPVLPLLGAQLALSRTGFAGVLALVAAADLGVVVLLSRENSRAPRLLRELAWAMFGAGTAGSVVLAGYGLATASTVGGAIRAALALIAAAAVVAAGGLLVGSPVWRQFATGGATLAIIVAVGRVDALAWPNYTLVLTAALAAGTALATNSLPAELRLGPQRAALVAAGLTAIAVSYGAVITAVATVRASVTPAVWSAQLAEYSQKVQVTSWQVPAAAVLIAIVAAFGTPARWRADALALGGALVVLSIPGTGAVAWWAVPLLGVVAAALAGWLALYSSDARSCLLRTGCGAALVLHAGAASLARPWLTAVTFAGITAVGVAIAALGPRLRPADRLADRVVDAAGALATAGFPVLVGSLAFLAYAPARVLVPLTILAASMSLVAAALAQVAAPGARTATAAGALAAAAGCVALSLRVPHTPAVDVGLSLFLVATAIVIVAARAFEVSPAGIVTGLEAAPAALGALTDAIEGDQKIDIDELTRQPHPTSRTLDGVVLGSAGATAALIAASTRLASVTVPGIDLVIAAIMLLLAAMGVRALPATWRRGPRLGATAVGGALGLIAAAVAVAEAVAAVLASTPWWRADLDAWTAHATRWAPFGWQVPATLLLAAAAAWAMLPQPTGSEAGFVALALTGLSVPAAFGLVWWSPVVIAGALAIAAGTGAALAGRQRRVAQERLATAAALGLYATAVAMARPVGTAAALAGVVAGGAGVAVLGFARGTDRVARFVPGIAADAAMLALPGTAATVAVTAGATAPTILGITSAVTALEVLALVALRSSTVDFLLYPAVAVGLASLITALAAMPDLVWLPVWAGLSTVVGVAAAATLHPSRRAIATVLAAGAAPAGLIAAAASAPSWVTALFGPYRTLRQIWAGYAATPPPPHPVQACVALALLAVACAGTGYALGGQARASIGPAAALPPLAALALVAPAALHAPRGVMPWIAFAVALITGLGASLLRPARLLRATAGIVCALAGGAALAGSLATRANTIAAEVITVAAAVLVALIGRDPAIRMVAWIVASAAGLALPPTVYAALGRPVQDTAFWLLGVCAVLVAAAWLLASRTPPPSLAQPADGVPLPEPPAPVLGPGRGLRIGSRPTEAAVVELCALVGACFALLLSLHSARYAAGVLTVWGALIGVAALRRDRSVSRRIWLVRAACAAELGACWLVLYAEQVALPEAYTLPFAVVALGAGAWELRQRSDLSSWLAYGPALAAGFLPSLALVAIQNGSTPRQAALFIAGVGAVLIGSWRRKRAPVVVGGAVAVIVALHELFLLWVLGVVSWYYLFGAAGIFLVGVGATYERRRRDLRRLRGVLSKMS